MPDIATGWRQRAQLAQVTAPTKVREVSIAGAMIFPVAKTLVEMGIISKGQSDKQGCFRLTTSKRIKEKQRCLQLFALIQLATCL